MSEFDIFVKNYINCQKVNGYSIPIRHSFKILLSDYDMMVQAEDNDNKPIGLLQMMKYNMKSDILIFYTDRIHYSYPFS